MLRRKKTGIFLLFLLVTVSSLSLRAQTKIVDQVVAVVGNNIILQSDVENQTLQLKSQGNRTPTSKLRCEVFEDLLFSKLLLNQAKIDSIEITEAEIEGNLTQRLQVFINQIGSEEKLEEFYGKSILEIREDFHDLIRENLLTQKMQSAITGDIKVTPSEVRSYYNRLLKDSLPLVNSVVEISQIVKNPPFSEQAKFAVREKLLNLRKRILTGEKFATLAILYSEDPGSAGRGGDLGFRNKADFVPEFSTVAFSLKENTVSKIVETEFGFHIIQLVAKRGEQVNVRHILMKPKVTPEETRQAKHFLDSIANLIRSDSISFETAAKVFSDDENTRINGGIMINPYPKPWDQTQSRDTKFELDQFDPILYRQIRNLKVGEISDPFELEDESGNKIFKIVKLKSQTKPHRANIKDDYLYLQEMTKLYKQDEIFRKWIKEKQKITYVRINDEFKTCNFKNEGWVKK
ncbi:MAG: peptidylprolyl isomerase [Bacteroidales bacterium]|nr:peptidylprolyl isomerase [Bacteroidales bacterium]